MNKLLIRRIKQISSKYNIYKDDIYYSFEKELIYWIENNNYK